MYFFHSCCLEKFKREDKKSFAIVKYLFDSYLGNIIYVTVPELWSTHTHAELNFLPIISTLQNLSWLHTHSLAHIIKCQHVQMLMVFSVNSFRFYKLNCHCCCGFVFCVCICVWLRSVSSSSSFVPWCIIKLIIGFWI